MSRAYRLKKGTCNCTPSKIQTMPKNSNSVYTGAKPAKVYSINYNCIRILLSIQGYIRVTCHLLESISPCYCILADLLHIGTVSPILHFIHSGYFLILILMNYASPLYQMLPIILKQSLQQFRSDLMKTLWFIVHFFHRLLFLMSLLVYAVLCVVLYGR